VGYEAAATGSMNLGAVPDGIRHPMWSRKMGESKLRKILGLGPRKLRGISKELCEHFNNPKLTEAMREIRKARVTGIDIATASTDMEMQAAFFGMLADESDVITPESFERGVPLINRAIEERLEKTKEDARPLMEALERGDLTVKEMVRGPLSDAKFIAAMLHLTRSSDGISRKEFESAAGIPFPENRYKLFVGLGIFA
jgi:hypothetical protein